MFYLKFQDGVIFAWRGSSKADSPFELVASLTGHTKAVVCLAVGCKMLYSGSMDQSIKVCLLLRILFFFINMRIFSEKRICNFL